MLEVDILLLKDPPHNEIEIHVKSGSIDYFNIIFQTSRMEQCTASASLYNFILLKYLNFLNIKCIVNLLKIRKSILNE